jgi:hypothetical protein
LSETSRSYKAELVGVFGYPVAENPTVVMQEAAVPNVHADHASFLVFPKKSLVPLAATLHRAPNRVNATHSQYWICCLALVQKQLPYFGLKLQAKAARKTEVILGQVLS